MRDQYTYGYDRAGNRLYRENTGPAAKDEFYTYDGMYQLANFDRGDLNVGKTAISGTPVREEDFSLDPTGNWTDYVQKTSGTTVLDQDRDHNMVNEIDTDHVHGDADNPITQTTGTAWADPVYDAAGNTTTVAEHIYDGRRRRTIRKTHSGGERGLGPGFRARKPWFSGQMCCLVT